MNPVKKRYLREFFISVAAYIIVLIISFSGDGRLITTLITTEPWFYIALSLAPIVPIIFLIIAFLRYLNDLDELQQRIQLHAIAFTLGIIIVATFTCGLLENVGFPQLSYIWIFPATTLLWVLAVWYYSRRYA